MSDKQSLSYKDAGVDIDAGNALVENIKGAVKRTTRPEVMGGLGGFGVGGRCRTVLGVASYGKAIATADCGVKSLASIGSTVSSFSTIVLSSVGTAALCAAGSDASFAKSGGFGGVQEEIFVAPCVASSFMSVS